MAADPKPDPFAEFQAPAAQQSGDDPFAQFQAPAAATPPTAAATPGYFHGLVDSARKNLEKNTQDLKPTGGLIHDYVAAPLVHVANRVAQNIATPLVNVAQDVIDPAEEVQKRRESQGEAAFKASPLGDESEGNPISGAAELLGNATPLLPGAGSQVKGYANSEHPIEDIAGDAVTAGILAGVAKTVPKVPKISGAGELRKVAQDTFGAGEEFQKKVVSKYGEEAEGAREKNQKATEDTLRARGTVDEANTEASKKHVTQTVKQLKEDADKIREASEKRNLVKADNERQATEHRAKVEQTLQEREAAEHTASLRDKAEKDLGKMTDEYYAREDAVKSTAKKVENETWAPWHEKAKNSQINADAAIAAIDKIGTRSPEVKSALSQLTPSPEDAPPESLYAQDRAAIMKSQGFKGDYWDLPEDRRAQIDQIAQSSGFAPEPVDFNPEIGKPISLEIIHRAKSILGDKLARHEYAGMIEGEMKQVYSVLQQAEARGSMEIGALDDLNKAKAETAKYQQAFGRERPKRATVGEKRKQVANREAYTDDQEQARLAAVAKYDPTLVEAHKAVQKATEAVGQFQKPETLRKGLPTPPDRPTEKAAPELPTPRPIPEAPKAKPYPEPEPLTPQPEAPNMTAATKERLQDGLKKYGRIGSWVLRLVVGGTAEHLAHGQLPALASGLLVGQVAVSVLTRALDSESVLNWMAKPTTETVKLFDTLPPADAAKMREALTGLAIEDANKGGKGMPSPEVSKFLGPERTAIIAAAVSGANPKTAGEAKKKVAAMKNGGDAFMATSNPKGLIEPGNINIRTRPTVQNADGSQSTEYSTSFQDDHGHEVLVPTVVDGKFLTPDGKKPAEGSAEEKSMFNAAWQHYLHTGENLGKFKTADDADAYAQTLHNRGQKTYMQNAVGPNNHRIGSNDGETWYDVETGARVE